MSETNELHQDDFQRFFGCEMKVFLKNGQEVDLGKGNCFFIRMNENIGRIYIGENANEKESSNQLTVATKKEFKLNEINEITYYQDSQSKNPTSFIPQQKASH